jgi:hypothetical protein
VASEEGGPEKFLRNLGGFAPNPIGIPKSAKAGITSNSSYFE